MAERPIVVVGAGVAGCVVAGTLALESSAPILVIESGESHDSLTADSSRTTSFVDALARPSTLRTEYLVRRTSTQEPKPYPAGRGLGGSGEINALVASWGMTTDGDAWEMQSMGIDAPATWFAHLADLPHELRTVGEGEWGLVDRAFVASCVDAGIARHDALWNDVTCREGVGAATIFARGLRRSTGLDALLKPAIRSGRVSVMGEQSVARVVVRDGAVRGVELSNGDVVEARSVISCAGAFGSVELLQRSSLLPRVVQGVQDHPAVAFITREPLEQRSILSIGAIGRLSCEGGSGNVHLVPMNATAPGSRSHGALLVALMDVESRGSITLRDDETSDRELGMLSSAKESQVLVSAVRRVAPIVESMGDRLGVEFHLAERNDGPEWIAAANDEAVGAWIKDSCGAYAHAASSLPLGGEHLDRRGAARGVDGLWVADASVMPTLIAGNPTLTVAALARLVARQVAAAIAAS